MLTEEEEEIGSKNLPAFCGRRRDLIRSESIVVCDAENIEPG